MGVNYKEFSKEMDVLKKKIQDEIDTTIKDVVSSIFVVLKPATPIDTGWAMSNWIISVDTPRPFPVGSKKNVSSAKNEQQRSFTSFLNQSLEGVKVVYINNGVDYISLLNDGTSDQAPKNFVKIAVQKGLSTLNRKRVIK